jgi:hypothetical protein
LLIFLLAGDVTEPAWTSGRPIIRTLRRTALFGETHVRISPKTDEHSMSLATEAEL